jgi:aminoglycoside phosphotransferase (APT) family kinase protein
MRIDQPGQYPALRDEFRTGHRVRGPSITVGIKIDRLAFGKSETADPQHCHRTTPALKYHRHGQIVSMPPRRQTDPHSAAAMAFSFGESALVVTVLAVESITKNRQPIDVLRAMVARAYGTVRVPDGDGWAQELGHGWFNVAYRIRLRDGELVVLKIAPPAEVEVMTYERDMMATEVRALRLIRERTSVPVPDVHFYDESRELCDADYFFMEYVDADNLGIVMDQLPPDKVAMYREAVGALNRELHTVTGNYFGSLVHGASNASWRTVFVGMIEDVLRDGERRAVDIGVDYDVVRTAVAAHADSLDEVGVPVLVEWDMWESNVMVRDGRIVAVIDHERAFFGDRLMEAGFVATGLPAFGDASAFTRGYGWSPSTGVEHARRRLYNLHLILIMVIETVYRGHTEPAQYDEARTRLVDVLAALGVGG